MVLRLEIIKNSSKYGFPSWFTRFPIISDHHIYYHLIENIPNWMDLSKNEWKIIIDQRPDIFLKVQIP